MRKQTRRAIPLVALVAAVLTLIGSPAAVADPDDNEGGSQTLEDAMRAYADAQDALEESKDRQKKLEDEIEDSKELVKQLTAQVQDIAAALYMGGDLNSTTAYLSAENPDEFLRGAVLVSYLGDESAKRVNEYAEAKDDLDAELKLLDDEIEEQKEHVEEMDEQRLIAAQELAAYGGNATTGPTLSDAPDPKPVPRNPDGSLPGEGCSEDDPTTDGCISPRTLHILEQTQIAGFQRYVKCYRVQSTGEHGKGRACDYSAQAGGFGGDAYGADKAYGDNLAGWYVQNAEELGVLYVIWYRRIWMPGQGWSTYNGGGDPSSDHTNHVHLSVR